jgi:hypothetical protein
MRRIMYVVCVGLLVCVGLFAEDKPAENVANAAEPSITLQVKLMKDQRRAKSAKDALQLLGDQYQALLQKFNAGPEVQELQKKANDARAKQLDAEKDLQADKDKAFQEARLDKKEWDLDDDTLTFNPKAKAVPPAATSAEKK